MNSTEQIPCVTIKVSGGLGNQLFQYAAARSLAVRLNATLQLDLSFYSRRRHRTFGLAEFPIQATRASPRSPMWFLRLTCLQRFGNRVYTEPSLRFDSAFLNLPAPVVLSGYFQSASYFEEYSDLIREELCPPTPSASNILRLAEILNENDSVSLHVRRGDYASNSKNRSIYSECTPDYYRKALQLVPGRGPVVVFSDDMKWAKENLPQSDRYAYSGDFGSSTATQDLWLMTKARHHIIANSTFSWWGAWLAQAEFGQKISPNRWFQRQDLSCLDLIPAKWLRT